MKSYTKIRQMQEINKLAEKRYINENNQRISPINEGMFQRFLANSVGFLTRFKVVGQNIGTMFAGGDRNNPTFEAAKARVRVRVSQIQKELTDLEEDLGKLYDEKTRSKIGNRAEKLSATPSDNETNKRAKRDRGGEELGQGLEKFDESMKSYTDAIATLKGINQGFLDSNPGT